MEASGSPSESVALSVPLVALTWFAFGLGLLVPILGKRTTDASDSLNLPDRSRRTYRLSVPALINSRLPLFSLPSVSPCSDRSPVRRVDEDACQPRAGG